MGISHGFDAGEARDLLGMAVGADVLTPRLDPDAPSGAPLTTPAADTPHDPIPRDDGTTTAYPWCPIWPAGWTPAVDSGDEALPWAKSVLISPLGNTAILAHHAASDVYALSFAGTANADNIAEDLASFMVSASEVDLEQKVLGAPTRTLGDLFAEVGRQGIDLFLTGHSLGAPLASACMAWLTNTTSADVSIETMKCYTFASPKIGNDAFANAFDLDHTTPGMCFRVVNSLDTIPQFPLSHERLDKDVNNPAMITALTSKMGWKQRYYIDGFSGRSVKDIFGFFQHDPMPRLDTSVAFTHVGNPIVLNGDVPVVHPAATWPEEFYPGLQSADLPEISEMDRQWWQHHTPNYAKLLDRQFPT